MVDLLARIAAARTATPAQIALAWLLSRQPCVPIPGTTKLHRLEENIAAADVQLTDQDLREVEAALGGDHGEGRPLPGSPGGTRRTLKDSSLTSKSKEREREDVIADESQGRGGARHLRGRRGRRQRDQQRTVRVRDYPIALDKLRDRLPALA